MTKYFTWKFWNYAGERAIKTAFHGLFAVGLIGGGLFDLDLAEIGSVAGGLIIASLATSVMFYKGDGSDDPSDTSIGLDEDEDY